MGRWLIGIAALSLLAQDDDAVARHAAAASAAMQSGDYASAERHNRTIVEMRPQLPEARMNLGLSCFLQKKYEEAIQALEAGVKLKPGMANAWLFLGISRFNLNRASEALPALRRYTEQRPEDLQGHYYLGLSHLALDDYEKAEQALRRAGRIDDRNIDVLYHLAQAYLGQARKEPAKRDAIWPLYQAAVNQIAAVEPGSIRLAQLRAGFYEATGEKAKAIQELEAAVKNQPKIRGLHYTLGCLYLEALQYEEAIGQFMAELRLDSPYPRTYLQLAHAYIAVDRSPEALPLLRKAATFEPGERGVIWAEIGRAYRSMERNKEAVDAFQKAIKFGERDASLYYQLGMAARKIGDHELARRALEKSQELKNTSR
jgi:tetratricopeptide (TPR) repeat protein